MLVGVLGGAVAAWLAARAAVVNGDAALGRESGNPWPNEGTNGERGPVPSEPNLERQLDLLDRAIGRARNGVIITDCARPDLPIVYVNRAFLELTGYAEDEVVGRNCRFLQGEETDPADRERLRRAVARGEGVHVEIKNYRKDGSPFWNDLLISPIRDDQGRLTHFIGNQIDVSRRKAAEEALQAERDLLERRVGERTAAIRAQEEYQASIVETVREALLVLDEGFRVISANGAFYRRFRVSPEETVGRPLFSLGDGQWDIPRLRELLEEILPRHQSFDDFRVEHVFPGVGRRTMLLNARQVELGGSTRGRILLAIEDITERQSAERTSRESAVLIEAVITSLDAHIAVLDRTGRIIAVNDAWVNFARIGGAVDEGAFVGVNYLDVLRGAEGPDADEAPAALRGIEAVLAGETPRFSLEYPCDIPGACLWFLLQVTSLKHDGGGAVVAHVDITDRKRIEQRKDDFIGMASHELKTPITGMKLQTQSLQRQFARRGETASAERLAKMDGQIDKLSRLVQELLDVSRIHAGKLAIRPAPFDLQGLLEETVEALRPTAPEHRLVVRGGGPVPIVADRDRIEQVLLNLLTNAVKYSPGGGEVVVGIEAADGGVVVAVRDDGLGIDEAHQARIFERFYQASDAADAPGPGLGMGLYIASEIVKLHRGRLWVESARGRGSTFRFSLPPDPPSA